MADNESRALIILEADKASAAATQRLLSNVSADVKDLGKAGQLKGLDQSFEKFDSTLTDTGKRFQRLNENIREVKDSAEDLSKTKIKAFDSVPEGDFAAPAGEGGGDKRNRLTQIGSSIRNLPSVQIPGLGIGTDAIGNFARIGGALKDASDKAKAAAAVTAATSAVMVAAEGTQAAANTTVAVTSGSAAAGALSLVVALGPIAAIGVAIGVAVGAAFVLIKSATDAFAASAAENAAKITRAYESSDSVFDSILNGDTSEDARKKIEQEELKRAEADRQFSVAFQQSAARYAEIAAKYGEAAAEIAKNRGTDEFNLFADRMKEQKELAAQATANIDGYNTALDENRFAANDAAEAEKEREKKREEAARKAEQLSKEIEAAQDRITDAGRKNIEKQEDNARQAAQKLEDIETNAQDKRKDLTRKYNDDLAKIGLKRNRDEIDAQRKAQEKELDALTKNREAEAEAVRKQQQTLSDIRDDALRDERDQLRERNFLGAALIGEAAQEQVDDANKVAQREAEDRAIQNQIEAQERKTNNQRDTQERQLEYQRARMDRMVGYQLEQRDAKIAQDRSLRDAEIAAIRQEETRQIGYDRELTQLQAHLEAKLALESAEQQAERALKGSSEQPLRSGNPVSNSNRTNINDNRSLRIDLTGGGAQLIADVRKTVLQTMRQVRYS